MTRKSKPAKLAGKPGVRPGQTTRSPKPGKTPPRTAKPLTRGGFERHVKPVPLPGKSRGR